MTIQIHAYTNFKYIVSHPDLLGGKPCIRGTRIPVSLVLEGLAAGNTIEELNESYQGLITQDILTEVLKLAAELADRTAA